MIALADAGYTVDVVASDGYTVSFESSRLKRNDNMIVAHLVNGNLLPDKYFRCGWLARTWRRTR